MKRVLAVITAAMLLAACGGSDSDAEYNEAQIEADKTLADASVPSMDAEPSTAANTEGVAFDMSTHPLSNYFVAEGRLALDDGLGRFYFVCDLKERPQSKQQCDELIENALRITKRAGHSVTKEQLLHPAFWQMQLKVHDMEKAAKREADKMLSFDNGSPDIVGHNKWTKEFAAKQHALLDAICGGEVSGNGCR